MDRREIASIIAKARAVQWHPMTRLSDGLGVQVPEGRREAHERWLTGPVLQQEWLMKAKS